MSRLKALIDPKFIPQPVIDRVTAAFVHDVQRMKPRGRRTRIEMNDELRRLVAWYRAKPEAAYIDPTIFLMAFEDLCREALVLAEQQEIALLMGIQQSHC